MSVATAGSDPCVKGLEPWSILLNLEDVTEANYKLPTALKPAVCAASSKLPLSLDYLLLNRQISQVELRQQIESLSNELKKISEVQQCPLELDLYVRKLLNAKLKVTVVSNILQTAQVT
uniref:Biogenesis of lysosome-related organelles complex 1 subunit 7 n=1 Tax=Timema poppense TaxID=170557 RepID=A0A7R9HEV9_TIMPO|nr:unnamed protein product [Timema poppensis]